MDYAKTGIVIDETDCMREVFKDINGIGSTMNMGVSLLDCRHVFIHDACCTVRCDTDYMRRHISDETDCMSTIYRMSMELLPKDIYS